MMGHEIIPPPPPKHPLKPDYQYGNSKPRSIFLTWAFYLLGLVLIGLGLHLLGVLW